MLQIIAISTIFSYLCSTSVSAASLTLAIPSSFSLDITPSSNGTFVKSDSKNINVKTDNNTGYTLSIKAKNNNELVNGQNKLSSISSSGNESVFTNNTWGYMPSKFNNEDNTNFLPGPTSNESVLEETKAANNEIGTDYSIAIGAKIDNTIPTGSYSNNFIIQASANVVPEPTTMQGFGDYCKNMEEHQSLTLTDTRDNNTYTVAKLKDGNCWMTQNLRIGGDESIEISSENSDMTSGSFMIPANNLSNFKFSSSAFGGDTKQLYDNDAVYYDGDSNHGAYYTWHTATAGTGTYELIRNEPLGSICPKGWHLPLQSEYATLYDKYPDYTQMTASPIPHFFPMGYINSANPKLEDSQSSYYWSSTPDTPSSAQNLYVSSITYSSIRASGYTNLKFYGNFVRCIANHTYNYTIQYDLRGGNGGPSPNPQSGSTGKGVVTLSSATPTKPGSTFYAWCTANPDITGACSGTIYEPGDTYIVSEGLNTLNAIWTTDKGSLGIMQSFDCDSKLPNIHDYGTIIDSRDDNQYSVAKLADGKCWMVDNLKVAGMSISSSNSDMNSGSFTVPASNLSKFDVGTNNFNSPAYVNNSAAYIDDIYGGYYTWYTATAGSNGTSKSICPKGWRLPTGGKEEGGNDFVDLTNIYGGDYVSADTLRATPVPGFTDSGGISWTGSLGQGEGGSYWSSTIHQPYQQVTYQAYCMGFYRHEYVSADDYYYRVSGKSVRCIAR